MSRSKDIFDKLIHDGEKAINELILTRKSEELFLDFKRSSDNGSGRIISQEDRNNLGKAISGFGNSAGGVIIWGLQCAPGPDGADVVDEKFLLQDVKKFTSFIEGAVSGVTLPPYQGVENRAIEVNEQSEGFVVTYIPENPSSPLQTVSNSQFYIRAGSSFVPAPYNVLSSMFGKKPQPFVFVNYTISGARIKGNGIYLQVGIMFHNSGPGIAQDLFLNTSVKSSPGDNCIISFNTPDTKDWNGAFSFARFMSLISEPGFRLPPKGMAQPLIVDITLLPPFTKDLDISIMCGSGNSTPMESSLSSTKDVINLIYNEYIASGKYTEIPDSESHTIAEQLLRPEGPKQ